MSEASRGKGDRPWWARRSPLAIAFVVASIAAFVLSVGVPAISHWLDQKAQEGADKRAGEDRDLARKVQVSKLLFDHFFGKDTAEQNTVIIYLSREFPGDFASPSLQAVLNLAAKPKVKPQLTRSFASAKHIGQTALERAVAQEKTGFEALGNGDVIAAKRAFAAAYNAFPTYHNVDEILHKALGPATADFARASAATRDARLAGALDDILTTYSWGMPHGARTDLERELRSLR
jgi:hypothetical protein